jgi:hypothetical protein
MERYQQVLGERYAHISKCSEVSQHNVRPRHTTHISSRLGFQNGHKTRTKQYQFTQDMLEINIVTSLYVP